MPETTLPPPLTEKDIASSPGAAPAETAKAARKQETATPASAKADGAVADQLHDMIASKLDRIIKRKADREGVESFYKTRNYAPLWVTMVTPTRVPRPRSPISPKSPASALTRTTIRYRISSR